VLQLAITLEKGAAGDGEVQAIELGKVKLGTAGKKTLLALQSAEEAEEFLAEEECVFSVFEVFLGWGMKRKQASL
jgi:hypothetical protein